MALTIRPAGPQDFDLIAVLRSELWPDGTVAEHRVELDDSDETMFLAEDGEAAGFAAVSIRTDYVNGCDTSPVAFVEGLYVREPFRRQGVARALVAAIEVWAREQGLTELGSDALIENLTSHQMHAALDFEETERVVYFRKAL